MIVEVSNSWKGDSLVVVFVELVFGGSSFMCWFLDEQVEFPFTEVPFDDFYLGVDLFVEIFGKFAEWPNICSIIDTRRVGFNIKKNEW